LKAAAKATAAAESTAARSPTLPFRTVLSASFTVILMLLYLAASLIILAFQSRHSRTDLHYLLYSEAEGLAGYVAATGRLDFPELRSFEDETPVPVWLRVVEGGKVQTATPGLPALAEPIAGTPPTAGTPREGELEVVPTRDGGTLLSVRHAVWNRPGVWVEALTRPEVLQHRTHNLLLTLLVTGLILIPLSAAAGHFLARYALGPVNRLIRSIRAMDSDDLGHRLPADGPVREISELTEEFNHLLEKVERSVQHTRRFTANASHELRNPISGLRTGIEVGLRRERSAAEYRMMLESCLHEIDRVQRVVEGLMALAHRGPGSTKAPDRPINLAVVARASERSVRPALAAKGLELVAEVDETVVVPGDEAQLQLMLINLLDNAIKHSPQGSEVTVEIGRRDGRGWLRVRDRGPGIPEADRPFIFDRHYQGNRGDDGPRSSRIGGIGLDIVRWVVEVHRGQIRLADAEARGACFEIELPLWQSEG
jgi:signal transduction histidine kinase